MDPVRPKDDFWNLDPPPNTLQHMLVSRIAQNRRMTYEAFMCGHSRVHQVPKEETKPDLKSEAGEIYSEP